MDSKWFIWSIEHNGYWMSHKRGYTQHQSKAGLYSFEEAKEIVKEGNLASLITPNEAMIEYLPL